MQTTSSIKAFTSLQTAVAQSLDAVFRENKDKIQSRSFFGNGYQYTMRLVSLFLLLLLLSGKVFAAGTSFWASWFTSAGFPRGLERFILAALLFALWIVVGIALLDTVIQYLPKFVRMPISVIQTVFITPGTVILLDQVANTLMGVSANYSFAYSLAYLLLINLFIGVIVFFALLILSSMPSLFFLLSSNPVPIKEPKLFSSHDQIIKEVVEKVQQLSTGIQNSTELVTTQVIAFAKGKAASIGAQVQTFSPAFGAFSLFGLLTLIYNQDDVRKFINTINASLNAASGSTGNSNFIIFLFALVGYLIIFAVRYFVRAYRALRILEIVEVVCNLRLEELANEKVAAEQARQQAAATP